MYQGVEKRCRSSKVVAKKIAVRVGAASCYLGEESACERVPGPRSRHNNCIKAEAAPIAVDCKDQLQHEQEKYVHGHSPAAL